MKLNLMDLILFPMILKDLGAVSKSLVKGKRNNFPINSLKV
jgi:hypothetical protein